MTPAKPGRLILASGSSRRRELLASAGFKFEVIPADVDELDYPPGIAAGALAELLSDRKARAVAEQFTNAVVLGADTVVSIGDSILGKPEDAGAARDMLRCLGGNIHHVVTGVSVRQNSTGWARTIGVSSVVWMRQWTDAEIDGYLATGLWRGKAGGYGLQDERDDPFVKLQSGSATNVVGLPMHETIALLAEAGITPVRTVARVR